MNIDVTGRHLEVTDSLKSYILEKMQRLERHFDHVLKAHVILECEKLNHKAEASLVVPGSNQNLFANSVENDMYAAIDTLMDKLDRQVIKHKEKSSDHHRKDKSKLSLINEYES